jgi:hypothetical protein
MYKWRVTPVSCMIVQEKEQWRKMICALYERLQSLAKSVSITSVNVNKHE